MRRRAGSRGQNGRPGNLQPNSGPHKIQDVEGYHWEHVSSVVDSAPSTLAPPWQCHTTDDRGFQSSKLCKSELGSVLSQTFLITCISWPLTSVAKLTDAGNVTTLDRKDDDYILYVDSWKTAGICVEARGDLLRTWIQERATPGLVCQS